MSVTLSVSSREFSPAEVAAITGVSVTLQRDWRRREILPDRKSEGWSRFDPADVALIYALGFFTAAGFYVKDAKPWASMAVLPVLSIFARKPEAYAMKGEPKHKTDLQGFINARVQGYGLDYRFLVIAHANAGKPALPYRVRDAELIAALVAQEQAPGYTLLDLEVMASRILEAADGHLFTVSCEVNA